MLSSSPLVEQTDACENITFARLSKRAVTIGTCTSSKRLISRSPDSDVLVREIKPQTTSFYLLRECS